MALVLPAIIALIGAAFLALAYGLVREARKFRDLPRIEVEADVIGHVERRGSKDSSATFAAVFRFTTPDGQTIEVIDPVSRDFALDEAGSRKLLAYPLGHPELAVPPATAAANWFAVGLLLVLGFGGVAAGIYAWLVGPEGW